MIYNLGSHIIDQAYVLFGMPEKVGCRFMDVRGVGVDEGVSILSLEGFTVSVSTPLPLYGKLDYRRTSPKCNA